MPRALILTNPNSRNGQADLSAALETLRRGGIEPVMPPSDCEVTEAIARVADDIDLLIVGGGDGTLHTVINARSNFDLPLGILPLGTANDLARTIGLPMDPQACAQVIVDGRKRRIDLGEINGRYFFNVASLGISTEVTRILNRDLKARFGVFGYLISLWRAAAKRRVIKADLRFEGRRHRCRAIQVSVGNGRHYGGGMTIAADADIDDGMLDVVVVAPQSLFPRVHHLLLFRLGRHELNRDIRHYRVTEIELDTGIALPITTDGELTTSTPARFRVLPKALDVFVP